MARIYCTNCGKLVGEDSNFCAFCGTATRGEAARIPVDDNRSTSIVSPKDQTVEREHVSAVAQIIFGLHYLKTTGVILIMAVVIGIFDPLFGGILAASYLIILAISTHLIWSSYYFSIDQTHFHKQYGIIHKKSVTIPLERVQNVNITRGLIDQIFGIASIDIETAGGTKSEQQSVVGGKQSRAEGHLSGLDFRRAKQIHDILIRKVSSR